MAITWILVTNASEARLFATQRIGIDELQLIHQFDHPESREKDVNLTSDRPGRYESSGMGHGTFVESSDPKHEEAERFAKKLVDFLEEGRTNNQFKHLVFFAPPQFHGLLNKHCNQHLRHLIKKSVTKDYTKMTDKQLKDYFKEQRYDFQ